MLLCAQPSPTDIHIIIGDRPDPVIVAPTDVIVRVVFGCVCGSDLWYYRGDSPHSLGPIGHEFIGIVTTSDPTSRRRPGDLLSPRSSTAMACPHCLAGLPSNCLGGGRSETAESTAAKAKRCASPSPAHPRHGARITGHADSDLALTRRPLRRDVHRPPRRGKRRSGPGVTVGVVGDGAVGLSAARRETPRRRADHRPVPQPGPPRSRARIRCDRHRGRTR